MEQNNHQEELAVSKEAQSNASLYAIASTLVGTGCIPHKKSMKRIVKKTRKLVIKELGKENAEELFNLNKAPIVLTLRGIKNHPDHTSVEKAKLKESIINQLYGSYVIGMESRGWQIN